MCRAPRFRSVDLSDFRWHAVGPESGCSDLHLRRGGARGELFGLVCKGSGADYLAIVGLQPGADVARIRCASELDAIDAVEGWLVQWQAESMGEDASALESRDEVARSVG